jgi:hypothetical protein
MGRYTERMRALLEGIPRSPQGFTPEIASMCLTQLANGALQVIAQLEEANEDLEKENTRLVDMLVEAGVAPEWVPTVTD